MRKNVEINGFSEIPAVPGVPGSKPTPARVVVNEGDAWYGCFETIFAIRCLCNGLAR